MWNWVQPRRAKQRDLLRHGGCQLTLCIPAACTPSWCVAGSSRPHKHSSNLRRGCAPAGRADATWDALQKRWRSRVYAVCFPAACLCVRADKADKVTCLALPGKVVLTSKLDTQVISSSPPLQSSIPSQAWSIGINLTELLQKKYLLSINFLTAEEETHRQNLAQSDAMRHLMLLALHSDVFFSVWWMQLPSQGKNCHDLLKYPAVTRMPSITITVRTESTIFLHLADLSFSVFAAVMGLLWRPGLGTAATNTRRETKRRKKKREIYCHPQLTCHEKESESHGYLADLGLMDLHNLQAPGQLPVKIHSVSLKGGGNLPVQ